MADNRIYNFSAGPSMLPVPVLERCAADMLNYQGSGMSVMEMSHRSKVYDGIIKETEATLRRVLSIPDNYKVLFLQGGATTQFAAIPMNLLKTGKADYALTGSFASKAYKEAQKFGDMHAAFSSKETNFDHVPTQDELDIRPDADYFYICANNTIYGTEYQYDPETPAGVELVADMSSNILSKPVDVSKYGVIYAGAQKNMGRPVLPLSSSARICSATIRSRSIRLCWTGRPWLIRIPCTTRLPRTASMYSVWLPSGLKTWAA